MFSFLASFIVSNENEEYYNPSMRPCSHLETFLSINLITVFFYTFYPVPHMHSREVFLTSTTRTGSRSILLSPVFRLLLLHRHDEEKVLFHPAKPLFQLPLTNSLRNLNLQFYSWPWCWMVFFKSNSRSWGHIVRVLGRIYGIQLTAVFLFDFWLPDFPFIENDRTFAHSEWDETE